MTDKERHTFGEGCDIVSIQAFGLNDKPKETRAARKAHKIEDARRGIIKALEQREKQLTYGKITLKPTPNIDQNLKNESSTYYKEKKIKERSSSKKIKPGHERSTGYSSTPTPTEAPTVTPEPTVKPVANNSNTKSGLDEKFLLYYYEEQETQRLIEGILSKIKDGKGSTDYSPTPTSTPTPRPTETHYPRLTEEPTPLPKNLPKAGESKEFRLRSLVDAAKKVLRGK